MRLPRTLPGNNGPVLSSAFLARLPALRPGFIQPLAAASVAAFLAMALVLQIPFLGEVELATHHFWLRHLPIAPNPEIVLVEIRRDTPQSLGLTGRAFPLPRSAHALLVRGLKQAGARVAAFDLLFLDPAAPDEDAAFDATLRQSAPLAVVLATEELNSTPDADAPGGFRYQFAPIAPSLGHLPANVTRASAKAFDPGGELDGAILRQRDAVTGEILPHLAFSAALERFRVNFRESTTDRDDGEVRAGNLAWPVGADGELHVLWTSKPRRFQTYEYGEALRILASPGAKQAFGDKIVLIGDVSGNDFHRTPMGRLSGLEFVAQLVNTLLVPNRAQATRWRIPGNFMWAMLVAVLASQLARTLRPLGIAGALGCIAAALLAPGLALARLNWWLDSTAPLLAVVLASVAVLAWEGTGAGARARRLSPSHWRARRGQVVTEAATVLFVDVKGSTPLAEKLGPDDWRDAMSGLLARMFDIALHNGADVDRTLGDGLMAVFRESAPHTAPPAQTPTCPVLYPDRARVAGSRAGCGCAPAYPPSRCAPTTDHRV